MNTLFHIKDRYYVAALVALCLLSVLNFAYLGNIFFFDFDKEFSLPSLYHYMLLALCAWGFYHLMEHERAYDIWFYTFAYFVVDDIVTLHETFGWLLSLYVIPSEFLFFTKRALGEIAYLGVVGSVLATFMLRRFISAPAEVRKQFVIFAGLVLTMGLFGILVDSIHERLCRSRDLLCFPLGIIEDGGETLVTIAILHHLKSLFAPLGMARASRPA